LEFRSARSFGSGTPPWGSYMRAARSGPSALESIDDSSSEDDEAYPAFLKNPPTRARAIQRPTVVSSSTV